MNTVSLSTTWPLDLPVEVFIVEANVNILTSLLFLKKKTEEERRAEGLGGRADYPVFMVVAENLGFDRRGNKRHKRSPDGEELVETYQKQEKIRVKGQFVKVRGAGGQGLGLLINFGEAFLKDGITRIVNGLPE